MDARYAAAADAAVVGVGYFAAEFAAVLLSTPNAFLTIWPANGVLCAALLRRPGSRWPAILVATYPATLAFALLYGQPALVGSAYWVANVVEVTVLATVLLRIWPHGLALRNPAEILGLTAATAGAAVVGSAIGAFATAVWRPERTFDASAFSWWAADTLGVLTIAPIALTWHHWRNDGGQSRLTKESVAWIAAVVALSAVTVWPIVVSRHDIRIPFPILMVPLLTWSALRLGVAATAWSLLVLNSFTLLRHLHGFGDVFASGGFTAHNAAALQILMASLAATFLTIAAAAERNLADVACLQRRASQRMGYLAEITHEIRNPLSAILGGVEMAEGSLPATTETSQAFAMIKRAAARILEISDEVLMLSRGEPRYEQVRRESCWLPAVWRGLQIDCEALPRTPHVELEWQNPSPSVTLDTDRRRLEVVVYNLVGNALKFTEEGMVEVACSVLNSDVVITVRDTGIGISEMDQSLVFDLFHRGNDPSVIARHGTGVGLHTVRRYVEQLGGNIALSSTKGVGSTFEVRLPMRTVEGKHASSG